MTCLLLYIYIYTRCIYTFLSCHFIYFSYFLRPPLHFACVVLSTIKCTLLLLLYWVKWLPSGCSSSRRQQVNSISSCYNKNAGNNKTFKTCNTYRRLLGFQLCATECCIPQLTKRLKEQWRTNFRAFAMSPTGHLQSAGGELSYTLVLIVDSGVVSCIAFVVSQWYNKVRE